MCNNIFMNIFYERYILCSIDELWSQFFEDFNILKLYTRALQTFIY